MARQWRRPVSPSWLSLFLVSVTSTALAAPTGICSIAGYQTTLPALAHVYGLLHRPLIIIDNTVLTCSCSEPRKIGGDIEARKIGGDTEARKIGGDTQQRKIGGDTEARKIGGDTQQRKIGGDTEARKIGGDTQQRKIGGDTEARKLGGDTQQRKIGGDTEARKIGGDTQQRKLGGATEVLTCTERPSCNGGFEVSGRGPIRVYDGFKLADSPNRCVAF